MPILINAFKGLLLLNVLTAKSNLSNVRHGPGQRRMEWFNNLRKWLQMNKVLMFRTDIDKASVPGGQGI